MLKLGLVECMFCIEVDMVETNVVCEVKSIPKLGAAV
jgi:hypothetical protein